MTRVLRRQRDHGEPQDRLLPFALVSTCNEVQIQRMLTVLIRTAERHAWIADLLTSPDDEKPVLDHEGLLSRIPDSTDLDAVENALPRQNTHLLRVAAQLSQRLLDRLDHLHCTGNTVAVDVIAERARLLSNLAIRLAEVGQRTEALAPAQEAVDIRRRLAETAPAAYLPDLAMSLNNLANHLAEVGQRTEALAPAQEAAQLYRRLAETAPAAYLPNLAASLNNLAIRLAEVGQHDEARAVSEEAARARQQRA
ncbi:MAG: tetratricopeptide repeat protein [Actinomycetota bacterium]|nr:tetratricopeptide repeat protein [Actinomycetota bacterium]